MKAGRVSAIPFAQRNGKAEFNASGVVQVGPDRFVFTDNRDPTALFELVLNPDGTQREPIRRRPLSGPVPGALSDPEGLTRIDVDGGITLVMSSSLAVRDKTVSHDGLVRVRYTPDGDLTAEDMPGFRDWVVQQHPELAAAADLDADDGGLNIERVAWDPVRGTLLFGIRSPVTDAGIPVLRVRLDPAAPWTTAALENHPIIFISRTNSCAMQGIRAISYDADSGGFLVLLGRSISGGEAPFELCTWDGMGPSVRALDFRFAKSMKPEGVTAFRTDGSRRILIVGDWGASPPWASTDDPQQRNAPAGTGRRAGAC
ncbi:MAG TPA: hypothetical protein VIU87_21635, partial [Mycobacterium sp.]